VAKPVATAWANEKFGQQPKDDVAPPPQQEQQKAL
jgi:hypothetical protein